MYTAEKLGGDWLFLSWQVEVYIKPNTVYKICADIAEKADHNDIEITKDEIGNLGGIFYETLSWNNIN